VGVHCSIYKGSYNVSNVWNLNSPPTPLLHPASPDPWNSFNRYHFCICIHVYTLFALYSSSYPFPHHLPLPPCVILYSYTYVVELSVQQALNEFLLPTVSVSVPRVVWCLRGGLMVVKFSLPSPGGTWDRWVLDFLRLPFLLLNNFYCPN
jgi:hypothetical protein